MIILCVLTHRYEWRSYSHVNEGATVWHNTTDSGRKLWQPAEPTDDGRRVKCSLAHCRQFPLERRASLMGEERHVASKSGKVPAEALGCSLTSG